MPLKSWASDFPVYCWATFYLLCPNLPLKAKSLFSHFLRVKMIYCHQNLLLLLKQPFVICRVTSLVLLLLSSIRALEKPTSLWDCFDYLPRNLFYKQTRVTGYILSLDSKGWFF